MDMSPIISQMGILFIVVALGFVGAKSGVLNMGTNELLSRAVTDLILPCSILYSAFSSDRMLNNLQILLLTVVACVTAALLILLAWLLVKIFRIPAEQAGVTKFMIIFSNSVFIGFPVIRVIFGTGAIFYTSIINMVFMLLCYTYGITLVGKCAVKFQFSWNAFRTPMVVSSILAYIIYLTNFRIPSFFVDALGFIDQMTSPLSMLTIGCALAFIPLKNLFAQKRAYVALLIRMVLFPVAFYYLMGLFISNPIILGVATIIVAMPAPASTTMLCARFGGDQSLASSGVFLTTLLSIGTIPLICWLLFA